MKALWINVVNRQVTEVEYTKADLGSYLGGSPQIAYTWANGDTLFVDEDGLLKRPKHWFYIPERRDQPFAGNGLLVGEETETGTLPPTMTVSLLRVRVQFL
jgi:hypothetical protein